MKRLMLATLSVATLATPAWAADPEPHEPKNPWLAAGLSLAAPVGLGLAGLALSQAHPGWTLDGRWSAQDVTFVVMPLGLTAGYMYVGEPADGLLVGLFGSAAMAAGTYFSRGGTLQGTIDPAAASIWPLVLSSGLVLAAGAFAVSDVRDLVTLKNKERKGASHDR